MKLSILALLLSVVAALPQDDDTPPAAPKGKGKLGGGKIGGGKMGGGKMGGGKMGGGKMGGGKMGGGKMGGGKTGGGGKGRGAITSNELREGPCKDIIFIMARASTEPGNMGGSMGPIVCTGLKNAYPGRVACQGVGPKYTASIADNVSARRTTTVAVNEAKGLFTQAVTKCPNALIVFGGFSQGTAVMHNAVSTLPANVKAKLVAGVMFGDTRNKQDRGQIPNFPKEKVTIYCAANDGVCKGGLNVTGGHFSYMGNGDGPKAIAFLRSKIDARGRSGAAAMMT